MRRIQKLSLVAVGLAAMIFLTTSATGAAALRLEEELYPHHCNSAQLQNVSCPNPGHCTNACAFHCGLNTPECSTCCAAFALGTDGRQDCDDACAGPSS